ncbi:MAG: hypothetical protein FD183_334 [Chitinophagaceae bacterium]|nr:MAG: hypothetical protein FD183_334 [Chitinophagaceae bacterium]
MSKNIFLFILITILFSCFYSQKLFAQYQLKGIVTSAKKEPLSNASVKVKPIHQNKIVSYSFTNQNGLFTLELNKQSLDSLEIEISCIGYQTQKAQLKGLSFDNILIDLETTIHKLPEVRVKSNPVIEKKDTLSYTIKPFTQATDAVIGDVLKRIPGIEVTESGVIKFQGRAINRYYIEGLNLLDDKYNVANRNIPATSVEKVQILENHQPIKILDSVSFSNQAALNLILTDKARGRIIGRLKLGAGISPLLLDNEINPMKFNKNTQFINSYKYNNTGINYSDELTLLNSSNISSNFVSNTTENPLLSIPSANIPRTNTQRFLFNNSHTLTFNQLYKSKTDIQFKESQALNLEKILSRFFFTVEKNTKNYFFLNAFKIQYLKNRNFGQQNTTLNTTQSFLNNHISFLNNGNFINKKGSTLIVGNYQVSYSNMPQSLSILPGIYDSIFNFGNVYDELLQKLKIKTFYAGAELGLSRRFNNISFQNTVSANFTNQNFTSNLLKLYSGKYDSVSYNFNNQIDIHQYLITNTFSLSYKIRNAKVSLSVPVAYIDQKYQYTIKDTSNKRLFYNYNLSVQIPFTSRISTYLSSSLSTYYTSPYFSTNNTILSNYRMLQNNAGIFNNNKSFTNSLLINYKDALKIIFASIGVTQEKFTQPFIYNNLFIGNLSIMEALLFNNTNSSWNVGGRISKYFISLKTSLVLGLSYKRTENFQMNKNILSISNVNSLNINSTISSKIGSMIIDHSLQYQRILSGINQTLAPSFLLNQTISNSIVFSEFSYIKINVEQSYFKRPGATERNFFFIDLSFKRKLKNKKIDIEANWLNILNTNNFETLSFSANNRTQSFYVLRPAQAMLKVAFNF